MLNQLLHLTRPLLVIDTETTGVDTQSDRIIELGLQKWTSEGMEAEWRTLVNCRQPIPPDVTEIHGITNADLIKCQTCNLTILDELVASPHCVCEKPKPWPSFKDLAPLLAKRFTDCDYAGKNCRYDLRMLASEFQRAGVAWSYVGARIIDIDRLEQLAVPRDLGSMHEKYVRTPCLTCHGRGHLLTDEQLRWRIISAELTDTEKCFTCHGLGHVGHKHDGAHGALSDVRASTTVIVKQLETHAVLPRDLDKLHELSWPGWLTVGGEFKIVGKTPICNFGKHKGKTMQSVPIDYYDFILKGTFAEDVKQLARDAKMGKYPTGGDSSVSGFRGE